MSVILDFCRECGAMIPSTAAPHCPACRADVSHCFSRLRGIFTNSDAARMRELEIPPQEHA